MVHETTMEVEQAMKVWAMTRACARCASVIPLLLAIVVATGCGARTGLLRPGLPELDGAVPPASFTGTGVTGTCQCGACKTNAWCMNTTTRAFVCDLFTTVAPTRCPSRDTCPPGSMAAPSVGVFDQVGTSRTLFCANVPDTCEGGSLSPFFANGTDPGRFYQTCLLEDGNPSTTPVGSNRAYYCGSADNYSCNVTNPHPEGGPRPDHSYAQRIPGCPKARATGQTRVCANSLDPTAAQADGQTLLGAMCHLWSGSWVQWGGFAGFGPPQYTCFARAASSAGSCVHLHNAETCDPVHWDPGIAPLGDTYDVVTGGASRIETTPLGLDAGAPNSYNVVGSGAVTIDDSGTRIILTQLDLRPDPGSSWPVSDAWTSLEGQWTGTYNSGTGVFDMSPSTIVLDAQGIYALSLYARVYDADGAPTAQLSSGDVLLHVHFTDSTEAQLSINLYVQLHPHRARPTATITSILPSTTAECSSSAGANFTVSATASASGDPTFETLWSLPTGDPATMLPNTLRTTFTSPLLTPSSTHPWVSFQTVSGDLNAISQTRIQVIDTTAPANGIPIFLFGCSPGVVPSPIDTLCDTSKFYVSDTCDPLAHAVVDCVQIFNRTGAMIQTMTCDAKLPVPSNDPSLVYEVKWHSVDSWGNNSATWLTRLTQMSDSLHPGCANYYTASILYNGLQGSAPARPTDAMATFDWSRATTGVASLPSGVVLTRTTAATVQTGMTSVVTTGIGPNVARVGADSFGHQGLVIEEARTNLVTISRALTGTGWYGGWPVTTTDGYDYGPDGTHVASRSQVSVNGYSNFQYFGTLSGQYVASEFVRPVAGGGPYQLFNETTTTVGAAVGGYVPASFRRVNATYNFLGGYAYLVPADARGHTGYGGIAATALDEETDLYQFEAGAFPTEPIVTIGAAATRAGDRLYAATGSSLVQSGRLTLELRLQAKGGWWEYTTNLRLWSVDANNYGEMNPFSGAITVVINGVTNTTNMSPAWSRLDAAEIFIAAGGGLPTNVQMRVNQYGPWVGTITGPVLGALSVPGALDLVCKGPLFEFSSFVQAVTAWHSGMKPNWAI